MDQVGLFGTTAPVVTACPVNAPTQALADRLPTTIRLGTSSWTFPGWAGHLYRGKPSADALAKHGLPAYSHHPLLRTVGVDRTFYKPVETNVYERWRDQVPSDFRFLVKAHDHVTTARFPKHPRFGRLAGTVNPRFLDPTYATEAVVKPTLNGLQDRLGVLLFQFPPHAPIDLGDSPRAFAIRLYRFLKALPKDARYAVEVRNEWCLGKDYAGALRESGTSHCFNIQSGMPPLSVQRDIVGASGPQRVIRWLLRPGMSYEDAKAQFAPFHTMASEDAASRDAVATLIEEAQSIGEDSLVIINNKAEGCSPASVESLAKRLTRSSRY
jgi:uncharacterized protein YecE (DUF72 family)